MIFGAVVFFWCATALYLSPHAGAAATHLGWALLFPIACYVFARRIALGLCLAILCSDFIGQLRGADYLRRGEARPGAELGVVNLPQAPELPKVRRIAPLYRHDLLHQDIRYLPLLRHQAYAFSAGDPPTSWESFFHEARTGRRWNSFLLEKNYFALVHSEARDVDLIRDFAIEKPLLRADARIETLHYDYNSLALRVSAAAAGKLFWSDGYDPDWHATVNGRSASVELAGGAFKTVEFPRGTSRIEFRFRPKWFLVGLGVFYLTITVVVGLAAFLICRRLSH